MIFYVNGSRVRGDHRQDSDVDIHYVLPASPSREFTVWWTEQNMDDFKPLRQVLPGRLEFLDPQDPLGKLIEASRAIHRDRNVICVCCPAKPRP
jgi:predicted nucleotidyltransferase